MAGGMVRGRSGRSLGERAENSGIAQPGAPAALHGPSPQSPPEGRHCWVRDPPQAPGTWPGLLVEWRRSGDRWQGRVAFTVAGPDGPALVETWLAAERLEPR